MTTESILNENQNQKPEPVTIQETEKTIKKSNPLFIFMAAGSFIYAFFYTLFLYKKG